MTFTQQQEIDRLVELASKPSSNQNKHRHDLYAYIDSLQRFNPETQVAFVWSIEDVKFLIEDEISDEQAFEILQRFDNHHEGSMEQMWHDLEYHVSEWQEEQSE